MHLFVKLLLLVTAVQCITNGENSENSVVEQIRLPESSPAPEASRFKKFLNLFGIGSSNQLERGDYSRGYPQYGYPCAIPTTTTPAPVTPMLCPFPPMLPAQLNTQKNPHGGYVPSTVPHPPSHLEQFPPPPQAQTGYPHPQAPGTPPLLPPHNGSNFKPGFHPQSPYPGQPPFVPPGSGMKPDQSFPSPPPFPGQSIPTPIPIQNLPQPVQPGQGGSSPPPFPTFPGPLFPSNIGPPQNPGKPNDPSLVANSGDRPEQPTSVKPVDPEQPVKVNPVAANPSDPVKVNPSIVDPTKPVQVNPINFKPNNPMLIDPIHSGGPLHVSPSNDQPLIYDPFRPYISDKGFLKNPLPKLPYGPMNVLINPGYPEQPEKPLPKPSSFTNAPTAPVKTELPKPKPGKVPVSLDPHFPNGIPFIDGYGIYGPIQGSLLPSQFGSDAVFIGPILPHGINQLPGPPLSNDLVFPNPPSFSNNYPTPPPNPNKENAVPFVPGGHDFPRPPHPLKGTQYQPPSPPTTTPVPPPLPPPFPQKQPESFSGSQCGNPFLRPYVPPGFHLSSINQFIGLPPANPRFIYPCPTIDLLKALDFKIMRSLIEQSGLLPLFQHTRNYTLFVPSDASFRRLPRWFRESLDVDKKLKKALVLNHLIKDDLPLDRLENEELVLTARPGGHRIRVNIYQPANTYRTITVDGSEVEKGDILTSTGRVHIVNKVLMPNLPRNAAQFLSEKLEFENFWNLIKQADLLDSLQSPRPFTLFIPVNEAVQKLNDSTFINDREKLRNFINYHIVNGTYYSNGIINNEFLLTNYEKEIKLQVVSDDFAKSLSSINGNVRILKSDITLTNGVAHVIDKCISEDTPFYMYPQSDEFRNEYGVMKRSFRVTSEEKNISNGF